LIQQAAKDFEIDLGASWMAGDRYSDIELAHNAGLRSAFVLSGYGRGEWEYQSQSWLHRPDLVCENLLEAVKSILDHGFSK
jgi:D-glycero-D-manno-heptose 1,7-bisphosphate phosphatase